MKDKIYKIVSKVLIARGITDVSFVVEYPLSLSHGDYAVNVAMIVAKKLGKSPRDLADEFADVIKGELGDDAESVCVAGPGFINITLSKNAISAQLNTALVSEEKWGSNSTHLGERVIIEYGNPNPFKEMHAGHLMGAIIGEAFSRLIENSGATVTRDTFGGDVGPQVAKAVWGLRDAGITEVSNSSEIGKAYTKGSSAYEENPKIKKEIDDLNVEIYKVVAMQNKPETLSASEMQLLDEWRTGRSVSMEAFDRLYKIIGTQFDYTFYDSDTIAIGVEVVREGLAKGVFEESDGAIVYRGEKVGLYTLVFITGRGTPTYETKDIGLAFLKDERSPNDRSIIVTANEQIGHFKVVLAALNEVAPLLAKKTTHSPHGFLRLTTGKMSSRKGTVIKATELIESVVEFAKKKNTDPVLAEQVAVAGVKYMALRQSPGTDIIFDPKKSLSLDGDSGPYLQYSLVRAISVLRIAQESGQHTENTNIKNDAPSISYDIVRLIIRFPDIAIRAEESLSPNLLVTYLTELAGEWNSFYAQERIIGGEYEAHKLMLAQAFVNTMKNGLTLLGIPTPQKM